jgi:multidrug transporter EmrE-like cation transporter
VGIVCSTVLFDEAVTPSLIVAMMMILGGIATGLLSTTKFSSS